jgi:hypothetical protein
VQRVAGAAQAQAAITGAATATTCASFAQRLLVSMAKFLHKRACLARPTAFTFRVGELATSLGGELACVASATLLAQRFHCKRAIFGHVRPLLALNAWARGWARHVFLLKAQETWIKRAHINRFLESEHKF